MDALLRRAVAPCTAAYSTAQQRPPDCRTLSDRPGATCAQRQRGYEALSRKWCNHERFGRNDPFVTLTFDLGVQPASGHWEVGSFSREHLMKRSHELRKWGGGNFPIITTGREFDPED